MNGPLSVPHPRYRYHKLAVLVSGTGSLLEAMLAQNVPIGLVLADRDCRGIEIARQAKIPTVTVFRTAFGYQPGCQSWQREEFTRKVMTALEGFDVDLVVMAGFMTIFHPVMFTRYGGRVLNIHPALLPNFRGGTAVADTVAANVATTGSTIHVATEVLDDDRYILRQSQVSVRQEDGRTIDTVDELWERIKVEERRMYPEVLWAILRGEIDLTQICQRV